MLARLAPYPTLQMFLALALALFVTVLAMPPFIGYLKKREIGQQIRADGPGGHLVKQGTPTMGGLVVLAIMALVFFFMVYFVSPSADYASFTVLQRHNYTVRGGVLVVLTALACGLLGLVDDSTKVSQKRSLGLTARAKIIGQVAIAFAFSLLAVNWVGITPNITLPATSFYIPLDMFSTVIAWFGGGTLYIPWLYIAFASIMLIAMSNAVNLTDGLDGLAAGSVTIVSLVFGAIAYAQDNLPVAIVAVAISGACVGFLWYNAHPAEIFMGDTGSLGLGGALAALAAVTKTELLLVIIGGIFVIEALSVVLQVAWFKRFRTRIFKMAPIHHHFEMKGWSETKIMVRFWIITAGLAGLGFTIYFFQRGAGF